jgi:hypothetical protein
MALYISQKGTHPVRWVPEDTQTGKQAIIDVVGEPSEYPVEVSPRESEQIRDRYRELVEGST